MREGRTETIEAIVEEERRGEGRRGRCTVLNAHDSTSERPRMSATSPMFTGSYRDEGKGSGGEEGRKEGRRRGRGRETPFNWSESLTKFRTIKY
jgi:hypothetical protein